MADQFLVRQFLRRWRPSTAASSLRGTYHQKYAYASTSEKNCEEEKDCNQWLILPSFNPAADGTSIGKQLHCRKAYANMTSSKWIHKCCPELPRSLVQKLFRLRQVRKEVSSAESNQKQQKRVGAKDLMNIGDKILLPKSVHVKFPSKTVESRSFLTEEESEFICSLELYKDPAIIVLNKPPGMPVQGGLGIKRSLDELAAKYLKYDHSEPPRLVHRLDRDSSGLLLMGRTQLSTTVLHSIFHEKTLEASNDLPVRDRVLQKKYYALVIGCPRRREGLISVPLMKVIVDNGKSERITVVDNNHSLSVQHSVTEYRVIASSHGYSWLELIPFTGRKHQLRVHCAEVLGTPIVGDYKYGWQAHKKLGQFTESASDFKRDHKMTKIKHDSIGFELEGGSISDKQPFLHLHCKEMVLPNISQALQHGHMISDVNYARIESIKLDAPLPAHMQRSWDSLN
ncbi:pseudouridine synthase family protein [Striga asiatica]|uniref:Pseudouridine synthase family protein n=1 Tax=Striga asiatica TaxID=4170 RepID=A0A5A7QIC3_STRAF|nr:pseudouridine synthase family protein [Striga asiatica]